MVLARNAIHSALFLVLTMLSLGVFYILQAGSVHRPGADHRLHRRDHDAVPVRADAGRPGRLRLGHRDAARPAGRRGAARPRPRRPALHRRLPRAASTRRAGGRPARPSGAERRRRRQRAGHRAPAVHPVHLRLRGHLGAADHGGARRDGARARAAQARATSLSQPEQMRARFAPGNYPAPKPGPGVFAHVRLGRHAGPPARRLAGRAQHLGDPADARTHRARGRAEADAHRRFQE